MNDLALDRKTGPLRIMPIAELKAHLSEVVRGLVTRARPLVITLNGKSEYDRICYRTRFLEGIAEGLADVAAGRSISDEALGRRVEQRYANRKRTR
ncbi:MAG TPA: hypothetical protein VGO00_14495 [Kofleriaceae bacterium]|nr:hypothetical protein [Kofleriaceae bacterium]